MKIKKNFWLYLACFSAAILLIFDIAIIITMATNNSFLESDQTTQSADIGDVLTDTADELFGEADIVAQTGRYSHSGGEEQFVANELVPQLNLNEDGTFIYNENKDSFMSTFLGNYTQEEGVLTLFVESSNVVVDSEIIFNVLADNTIVLQQDIYSSKTGDEFILN